MPDDHGHFTESGFSPQAACHFTHRRLWDDPSGSKRLFPLDFSAGLDGTSFAPHAFAMKAIVYAWSRRFAVAMVLLVYPAVAVADLEISYLYSLADFTKNFDFSGVPLYFDRVHDELYVRDGRLFRVFNASGMEIFRFETDPEMGAAVGVAVDEEGDLYVLSYAAEEVRKDKRIGPACYISRCSFNGEFKERIDITNLTPEFVALGPNRIYYSRGRLVLVNTHWMSAIIVDRKGVFERGYDLAKIIGAEEKRGEEVEIFGFALDDDENFYFTVPVHFRVYVVSADGRFRSFGRPGSTPGYFGIVDAVAVDQDGRIFVADKLKSVVMVFSKDFKFLTQFGFYGIRPDNLTKPTHLIMGNNGRLYVSQMRRRGVSVFSVTSN